MRLRNIILCAAAAACAAMMTSCSKDDDKEETLDICGLWDLNSAPSMSPYTAIYMKVDKDSIYEYYRLREGVADSLSTDSIYDLNGDHMAVTSELIRSSDSSTVKAKASFGDATFTLKKTISGKYVINMEMTSGSSVMSTAYYDVKRADESVISHRKITY